MKWGGGRCGFSGSFPVDSRGGRHHVDRPSVLQLRQAARSRARWTARPRRRSIRSCCHARCSGSAGAPRGRGAAASCCWRSCSTRLGGRQPVRRRHRRVDAEGAGHDRRQSARLPTDLRRARQTGVREENLQTLFVVGLVLVAAVMLGDVYVGSFGYRGTMIHRCDVRHDRWPFVWIIWPSRRSLRRCGAARHSGRSAH